MIRLGFLALGAAALLSSPSNSRSVESLSYGQVIRQEDATMNPLLKRHGDKEHEHEDSEIMIQSTPVEVKHPLHHSKGMHASSSTSDSTLSSTAFPMANHHETHSHNHSQSHGHGQMHQSLSPIPDPLMQSKDTFIPVPPLPHGAGGHSHGSHGSPKMNLNETLILRGKGPDPLSYIEWDFGYGIGKLDDLLRFSQATKSSSKVNVMGIGGIRWRTLVDERDTSRRMSIASDILQRAQNDHQDPGRHGRILLMHVVGCIISCFVLLPIALALRAANSSFAPLVSTIYLLSFSTSLFMSMLYKAMTPQLYPNNSHGRIGYAVFWISLVALGGDVFQLIFSLLKSVKIARKSSQKLTIMTIFQAITICGNKSRNEVTNMYDVVEDEEERMLSSHEDGDSDAQVIHSNDNDNGSRRQNSSDSSSQQSHRVHFAKDLPRGEVEREWSHAGSSRQGSGDLPSPTSTLCNNTPRTSLFGDSLQHITTNASKTRNDERVSLWRQFDDTTHKRMTRLKKPKTFGQIFIIILRYLHVIVARSIPVISFAAAYTGLAVYTGSCRGPYKNVCLAHGIKGGIFFWYGLLSFSRYLGAYADLGWAWNRQPTAGTNGVRTAVSAEWVECFVIFLYGASNTWMERFGAAPGDPYTVKQIQHISIAVMFWFAGLMGLILETKAFKNLLALPVALKQSNVVRDSSNISTHNAEAGMTCEEAIAIPAKPPSYNFSFNPFPALVIGVTGVAMAAHHQDYIYEVSIHSLWGNLLAGFSIFRILTYFFLWLRPPTSSILPSRPPTEALASFSLACGGLVFMLSSEEVSFAAMRNGFGDFMMILNVTVAIVSLLFCGIATLMILKALAIRYERRKEDEAKAIHLEQLQQSTTSRHSDVRPVFVLEDENEDEKRREMSSSPLRM